MSAEERKRILAMVESGKITADQALTLIQAIQADVESEAQDAAFETEPGPGADGERFPEFERTAAQARRFSQIPLIVGIVLTVLSAWGMYTLRRSAGANFWYYCLGPLLLAGVAATVFGAWGHTARWLFVRVENPAGGGPRVILLGFPLPIQLAGWFLRTFGHRIEGLQHTNVDEVVNIISAAGSIREPLIVNVDEGANGERVRVYIG